MWKPNGSSIGKLINFTQYTTKINDIIPHKSLIKQIEKKNKLQKINKWIIVTYYLKTYKTILSITNKLVGLTQIKTGKASISGPWG